MTGKTPRMRDFFSTLRIALILLFAAVTGIVLLQAAGLVVVTLPGGDEYRSSSATPREDALDGPGIPPPPTLGGAFRLTDQDGKLFGNADLKGAPSILYFGFTYCPDICPTSLQTITEALSLLQAKGIEARPVLVSIDPERDRPAKLKEYVGLFHPRLVGLTGSPAEIAVVTKQFGVYARKAGQGDDYMMDHTSMFYVLDADAKLARILKKDATPEDIVLVVERLAVTAFPSRHPAAFTERR